MLAFVLVFATAAVTPDYSNDALLKVLAIYNDDHRPPVPQSRHVHFGYIEWRALGMDWRFFYLPIVAPLSGSGPGGAGKMPNPFALTGTLTPSMPPMLDHDRSRAAEREFRRIQRIKRSQ